nr:unnamed protein product [Spirometra erinaceieuropaei]
MSIVMGDCDSFDERYGYDPYIGKCTAFIYSGCGGNENNFRTLEECEAVIGICPEEDLDALWPFWEDDDADALSPFWEYGEESTESVDLQDANLAFTLRENMCPLWMWVGLMLFLGVLVR